MLTYTDPDVVEQIRAIAPEGVDRIAEVAPAQNAALGLAVIRNRGSTAVHANSGGDHVTFDVSQHFSLDVLPQFVPLYTLGDDMIRAAAEDINAALAGGALAVGKEGLPLHRTDLAHKPDVRALAAEGCSDGRVMIDVSAG